MKKNLVLALAFVFVMGITCSAFAAANPFSDVPAKHWAYPAVAQLQKAGIVDGYGDGTYRGDRLATRYEMAQITAKAMARSEKADAAMKALIDKMAVEFAAELNNLGVRVAKLEKNASTIKFTGDARIRWIQNNDYKAYKYGDGKGYGDPHGTNWYLGANNFTNQRVRLYLSSDLNDKVSFNGTIAVQNQNGELAQDSSAWYSKQSFTSQLQYAKAYFTFKDIFPYGSLRIGRDALSTGGNTLPVGSLVYGTYGFTDGVSLHFGKVLKGFISYGDIASAQQATANGAAMTNAIPAVNVLTTHLSYPINNKWTIYGYNQKYLSKWAWSIDNALTGKDPLSMIARDLYGVGVKGTMGDFTFVGDWVTNEANDADFINNKYYSTKSWWGMLMWKGADMKKPGTWGLFTTYRDFGSNVVDGNVTGHDFAGDVSNKKGWTYGMNYTISKNVVFTAHILDLRAKDAFKTSADGDYYYKTYQKPAQYDKVYYFRTEYWF